MRVPAEAGGHKAKVTVAFPAWKEVKVAPASVEMDFLDRATEDPKER